MRDPLAPIPSPGSDYWSKGAPPPPPERRNAAPDPHDLLTRLGHDALALDRRTGPRHTPPPAPRRAPAESSSLFHPPSLPSPAPVIEAEHEPPALETLSHANVSLFLALRSPRGAALVRTLAVSPRGVLLRQVDPGHADLSEGERERCRAAVASLSPVFSELCSSGRPGVRGVVSSPLATVGGVLLGRRVVSDLCAWQSAVRRRGRAASIGVSLYLPPLRTRSTATQPTVGGAPHLRLRNLERLDGQLAPLNDPQPGVLAIALDRPDAEYLRRVATGEL